MAVGGLTPAELAASDPLIAGTRWSVEGTMVVDPDGQTRLCASYVDGVCEAGATVSGPVPGEDQIVIEGIWWVVARDGVLTDPIWAG